MDFTAISGRGGVVDACGITFDKGSWGPLLISIESNQLHITKYYLEELGLNPCLYLLKPKSKEEKEVEQLLRKSSSSDHKEYKRYKAKLEKYNKIIALVLECKNKSGDMIEYLLNSINFKFFWTK